MQMPESSEIAIFAAGCFWDVEAVFRRVEGVVMTEVGYMGGTSVDPKYKQVSSGTTGHVEVVRVTFDPKKVSFEELLEIFWGMHDPTSMNRQGNFTGPQYRSAIFFHSSDQEMTAHSSKEKKDRSGQYSRPIVTEILPATTFYRAEEEHQQFYEKCGSGYRVVHQFYE